MINFTNDPSNRISAENNIINNLRNYFLMFAESYSIMDSQVYAKFLTEALKIAPRFARREMSLSADLTMANDEVNDLIGLYCVFPSKKFYPALEFNVGDMRFYSPNEINCAYSFITNSVKAGKIGEDSHSRNFAHTLVYEVDHRGFFLRDRLVEPEDVDLFKRVLSEMMEEKL